MGKKQHYRLFGEQIVSCNQPSQAWKQLEKVIPQREMHPRELRKSSKSIRFVCLSDTHSLHDQIVAVPEGDVLIHAGDITKVGYPSEFYRFVEWLAELPHKHKIIVAGNHDISFEIDYYQKNWPRFHSRTGKLPLDQLHDDIYDNPAFTYLKDSSITIEGIKIYGSPYQPAFFNWAFNLERGDACASKWSEIPKDTDILITHGPPLGFGDLLHTGYRAGCVDLLAEIRQRVKPKFHVFGHIHEAAGVTTDGQTIFINASICNLAYQPINIPLVFDYEIE